MSTSYSIHTAECSVKCTRAQFAELKEFLDGGGGFELEYYSDGAFLSAEENGNTDFLPEPFLVALGKLMADAKMSHLEVGFACTASRMHPGSHGGGCYRIMPDGSIVTPSILWP
jgi:hypothetical protein